jgi:hypothetical protein
LFCLDSFEPKIPGAISLNITLTGADVQIINPPIDDIKKIEPIIIYADWVMAAAGTPIGDKIKWKILANELAQPDARPPVGGNTEANNVPII